MRHITCDPRRARSPRHRTRGAMMAVAVIVALSASLPCPADAWAQASDPPATAPHISCRSELGERQYCSADTSSGVALVSSDGPAPCLLGKTWGYDDGGIWVSDG